MLRFNLATNRHKWTTEGWEQITEWHKVVLFGSRAEEIDRKRLLDKGSQVYIEGRLQTRKWRGRDGNDCWTTEVVASKVEVLTVPKWKQEDCSEQ